MSSTNDRFYVGADKAFIADDYAWSGVGVNQTGHQWATMISPSYYISANHSHPDPGETVTFHYDNDPSSAPVTRTVASGSVGQEDVTYELRHYLLTNYGDSNLDRSTDFLDFQASLLHYWQRSGNGIGWFQGDFNGDGTVDFLDFQIMLDYWKPEGWSGPMYQELFQAPEPTTMSMLTLGGLAILRRRSRNAPPPWIENRVGMYNSRGERT